MPRDCTCCVHPNRDDIDARLVSGESLRDIAAKYQPLTPSALSRHHARHVSPALMAMEGERIDAERASLLDRIEALIERGETMFANAAAEGKAAQALAVLKELRSLLELLGKASGELSDRPTVTVNLLQSPDYLAVRDVILAALTTWPDARAVVSGRLLELEAGPQ